MGTGEVFPENRSSTNEGRRIACLRVRKDLLVREFILRDDFCEILRAVPMKIAAQKTQYQDTSSVSELNLTNQINI